MKFQQLLVEVTRAARAKIIAALERLRLVLIVVFDDKFYYIFHIPYLVVGPFYCTQGGSDEVARGILLAAMAEYDTAIADGRGNIIKGLAQTWFAPLSRVRQQMEAVSSSTLSLESYPLLFISLQEYALLAIVERRIERVHGVLKRIGVHAFGVSLPQLCAMVREEQSLELLQRSAEFSEYFVKTWHSRTLLDQILVLRYPQAELKKMSFETKLGMVYQCSLSEES